MSRPRCTKLTIGGNFAITGNYRGNLDFDWLLSPVTMVVAINDNVIIFGKFYATDKWVRAWPKLAHLNRRTRQLSIDHSYRTTDTVQRNAPFTSAVGQVARAVVTRPRHRGIPFHVEGVSTRHRSWRATFSKTLVSFCWCKTNFFLLQVRRKIYEHEIFFLEILEN